MHKIVDESGKRFKAVHYDHGSGIVVADVDDDDKLDIYFVNQVGGNELWRNLGGGKFENITESAGLFVSDRIGVSAAFADIDNVGFSDAFAGHLKPERSEASKLYRNLGDRKFEDVSTTTGMVDEGWTGDAAPIDINSDGWTDLYLLSMQGDDQVYFGDGISRKTVLRGFEITLFPGSHVLVRRCTFTGNRNAVDDSNRGNIYEDSVFWMNNAPGGWPLGVPLRVGSRRRQRSRRLLHRRRNQRRRKHGGCRRQCDRLPRPKF
jgi:hypothetical protein